MLSGPFGRLSGRAMCVVLKHTRTQTRTHITICFACQAFRSRTPCIVTVTFPELRTLTHANIPTHTHAHAHAAWFRISKCEVGGPMRIRSILSKNAVGWESKPNHFTFRFTMIEDVHVVESAAAEAGAHVKRPKYLNASKCSPGARTLGYVSSGHAPGG